MKAAVMQPYFFPYLGYFQLIASVETFIFFDDVNFIKKGWIHRNNILNMNSQMGFTVPLIKASQNKLINEIQLADFVNWRAKFCKTIELNYKKAPNYQVCSSLINNVLFKKEYENVSELAVESVLVISEYLSLRKKFLLSSDLTYSGNNGQEKIISLCKLVNADHYINPINGAHQYDIAEFLRLGIKVEFLQMNNIQYNQFDKNKFVPSLSILDLLMFNSKDQCVEFLDGYILSKKGNNVD